MFCLFCDAQEFIQSCVHADPKMRPTAHDLLFHRVLFEVHSLKLLAAHCFINNQCEYAERSGPKGPYAPRNNVGIVNSELLCERIFYDFHLILPLECKKMTFI